jgi:alkylhydroperoxidase family enzyme
MKTDPITLTSLRLRRAMEQDSELAITANMCSTTLQDLIDELRMKEWSDEHIMNAIQAIAVFSLQATTNE